MGIETRKNGNAYYYRKTRRNGRVVSEYVAGGEFGALMYRADQLVRAERAEQLAARRAELDALRRADTEARELAAAARELAALALLATGHHQHKGTWRKRRGARMQGLIGELQKQAQAEQERRKRAKAYAALPPLPAPDDMSPDAVHAIVARCNHQDATAEDVAALRRVLKEQGDDLARSGYGNRMRQAIEGLIVEMKAVPLVRELSADYISRRRRALGYADAPALEKPLIDHLLLCELRLGLCEQQYTFAIQGSLTFEGARYWEGRLSATQRRYLAAVETLARVRRVRVELARVTAPDGTRAESVAVERPGA